MSNRKRHFCALGLLLFVCLPLVQVVMFLSFSLPAFPGFRILFTLLPACDMLCFPSTLPRSGSAALQRLGIPAGQRTLLPLLPALAPLWSLPFPVRWRNCGALGSMWKLLFSTLFNTYSFPVILSFHLSVFLKEKAKTAGWSWVHSDTWPHSNINLRWIYSFSILNIGH